MKNILWTVMRFALGWEFLWAFTDKLLGLGFATCRDKTTLVVDSFCESAWLYGGSPTLGFLKFGTSGPFKEILSAMSGSGLVEWLFMLGLIGIAIGLFFNVASKITGISGFLMMILMYLAVFPKQNNPIIDDHIIYSIIFAMIFFGLAKNSYGLGNWWQNTKLVQKFPFLS